MTTPRQRMRLILNGVAMLTAYAAIALATTLLAPAPARAETLTFTVRSNHKNQVDIAFYSQNRKGFKWPADSRAWVLKDSEAHEFKLSCQRGETVCYGAWVRGSDASYWGVGENDKYSCSGCCYVCEGGATRTINLNPK